MKQKLLSLLLIFSLMLMVSAPLAPVSAATSFNIRVNEYQTYEALTGITVRCGFYENGKLVPHIPEQSVVLNNYVGQWVTDATGIGGYYAICKASYVVNMSTDTRCAYTVGLSGPTAVTEGGTMEIRMPAQYNPLFTQSIGTPEENCTVEKRGGTAPSTPTPAPTSTPAPTYVAPKPQPPAKAPIASATLPAKFTVEGSQTTVLTGLDVNTSKSVATLTIDDVQNVKIVYTDAKDLSDASMLDVFNALDQYVLTSKGSVEVKSDVAPILNSAATITMSNINLSGGIQIFKDGVYDEAVSASAAYDAATKVLTFVVTGFSKYEVASGLNVVELEDKSTEDESVQINGTVVDLDSVVTYSLNESESVAVELNETGEFVFDVELKEGQNTIVISSVSSSGLLSTQSIEVERVIPEVEVVEEEKSNTPYYVGAGLAVLIIAAGVAGFVIYRRKKLKVSEKVSDQKSESEDKKKAE